MWVVAHEQAQNLLNFIYNSVSNIFIAFVHLCCVPEWISREWTAPDPHDIFCEYLVTADYKCENYIKHAVTYDVGI